MSICGRNTSTPPTPASTPSTRSARIHAGAEARNADTPSESRPMPCSTRSESAVPGQPKVRANISASTAKKMGKANTRWVSTRSNLVGNGRLMLALAGEAGFIERLFDGGVARVHHQGQRVDAGVLFAAALHVCGDGGADAAPLRLGKLRRGLDLLVALQELHGHPGGGRGQSPRRPRPRSRRCGGAAPARSGRRRAPPRRGVRGVRRGQRRCGCPSRPARRRSPPAPCGCFHRSGAPCRRRWGAWPAGRWPRTAPRSPAPSWRKWAPPARRGGAERAAQSGWMPRRSSSSMRFKAMTTGRSSSISCNVR